MPPDEIPTERHSSAEPVRRGADIVIRAMRPGDTESLNALQNLPGFPLRHPAPALYEP
jgi:hypothetical protein